MDDTAFALVLNLHQPQGNLEDLLDSDLGAASEILYALDRIPRSLWCYPDTGRVHLSLSGTLLETLTDPGFQARAYGIVDCGSLLWHLQNTEIIDILGSAYYHPVLPLVPSGDWPRHLSLWRHIGERIFARRDFSGFWPPEMGFDSTPPPPSVKAPAAVPGSRRHSAPCCAPRPAATSTGASLGSPGATPTSTAPSRSWPGRREPEITARACTVTRMRAVAPFGAGAHFTAERVGATGSGSRRGSGGRRHLRG